MLKYYMPAMRNAMRQAQQSNDPDAKVGVTFVKVYSATFDNDPYTFVKGGHNLILSDYNTSEEKLLFSAHAEKMAIANARLSGLPNLSELAMVVTRHPCNQCMIDIWLSGCKTVVWLVKPNLNPNSKWLQSYAAAKVIAAKYHIDMIGLPIETIYAETSD